MAHVTFPTASSIQRRIADYMVLGGLFNPELARHEAVRDLLMECQQVVKDMQGVIRFYHERGCICDHCTGAGG